MQDSTTEVSLTRLPFTGALAFAFFMGCKDSAKIWISLCLRLTTTLISRCIFSLSLMSLPLSDELLTLRRRTKKALVKALKTDVKDTYNMISVDGDTSTNDTVLVLANGMAKNPKIHCGTAEYQLFLEALHFVNETLAKKMAGDGEGATALFEVKIVGAKSKKQAKVLAKSVVCSNLTKTAIAGHDANWGRILCAMGYSGAKFDPEKVDLFFESSAGKLQIIKDGTAVDYSEEKATEILSQEKVTATADLKAGEAEATAWGCDLTHGYIDINADYRS